MSALVWVGLVLAAGSTSVEGAFTGGTALRGERDEGDVAVLAHVRLEAGGDFGRLFARGKASVLLNAPLATTAGALSVRDLGSQVTLGFRPEGEKVRLALELRPFDSSVRFPAFDWANAWGLSERTAPMITALVSTERVSAWLGVRLDQGGVRDQQVRVFPGILAGFEAELPAGLGLELRGAFLQSPPSRALLVLKDESPLREGGGGARLGWTFHERVGPAVDLVTYATDPLRFERFFSAEPRRTPIAAWVGVEGGALVQERLPSLLESARTLQVSWWVDAQARVRIGALRLFGTVRAKPLLSFMLDQTLLGEIAIPASLTTGPQVSAIAGLDYRFPTTKLTPGLLVKVTQPAWFQGVLFPAGGPPAPGGNRYVLENAPGQLGLTPGEVSPLVSLKVSLRWDLASFAALVSEFQVEQDTNRDRSLAPLVGSKLRPSILRGQLLLQLSFEAWFRGAR